MRILLLNQNHIGDALFTTPAIAALRDALPDAYIQNAIVSSVRPIFAGNPHPSECRLRPTTGGRDLIRFLIQIRRARFDAVIALSANSTRFGAYALLSGASRRIGFDRPAIRRFLTHAVTLHNDEQHHVLDHLDEAAVLAPVRRDLPTEFPILPAWQDEARSVLRKLALPADRPVVGLNPGATMARKQWAVERWALLADHLLSVGCQPLLFGGPGDGDLVRAIQLEAKVSIPSAQGKLYLGPLAAATAECAVFVSGDTGPMHIAAAVRTPVVALHGPTNPVRTGPYTQQAVIVHHPEHDLGPELYGRMETVTVSEVADAVVHLLHASSACPSRTERA